MALPWTVLYFGPVLGFLLALLLLAHLVRQQRPPASTFAWLLAILLVPYAGVPLYMLFGGRKVRRMAGRKADLDAAGSGGLEPDEGPEAASAGLFPERTGNRLELLPTGEAAFRVLMDAIAGARHSICITTYILGKDRTGTAVVEALADKARQGVGVYLLLDAVGSRGACGGFLDPLRDAGGKCAVFMPVLRLPVRGRANLRNHRKIVLVDGRTAIVGGMNLAGEYMGADGDPVRWRDASFLASGPIVSDLYLVFQSDWAFAAHEDLLLPEAQAVCDEPDGVPVQVVPSGPDVPDDHLYDSILTCVFSARERVWIATPYFVPDEMLVSALCIAARRGVDVRVIVPAVSNHRLADLARRGFLRLVQESGGSVWLFQPGMLHGKIIVIDDSLGVLGSMNMDMRSLFLNYEIALFARSERTVAEMASWVARSMDDCTMGVRAASMGVQIAEGVGRLLAPLL